MKFLEVLPFLPVEKTFEYKTPLNVEIGDIIKCRFGKFDILGVVLDCYDNQKTEHNIITIQGIIFKKLINAKKIELIKKLEAYYGYDAGTFAKLFFPFSLNSSMFATQETMVKLTENAKKESSKAKKWEIIFNTLQHGNAVETSIFTGLNYFYQKGLLEFFNKEIVLENHQCKKICNTTLPHLSEEQNTVLEQIKTQNFVVSLIHGKTGSGKTEVYIHLIQQIIQKDVSSQILLMLPEIGLAKVITERLENRFNCKIPIWHSSISDGKRKQYFQEIQSGVCNIIVGTRSSLFLPFQNLRMIIVDEEHDLSYKQEESPIYNARDSAVLYGKILNIPVILGSATPSVESYYNAKTGKYEIFNLNTRYANVQMPEIRIIKESAKKCFLTEKVKNSILEYYKNEKQILIFINRRGYAPLNKCKACGDIFKCDLCDCLLTYHKKKGVMVCHKCSYSISLNACCTMCGAENLEITTHGAGVEAVYEEVVKFLEPQNKDEVAIFSSDEQNTENKLTKFIENVQTGKTKVIIGTQIASKGYDFPNLKLVCIMDLILKNDEIDFKADEKLMQLLTQVAGRSGRKGEKGLVLIQSKREERDLMRLMIDDHKIFYEEELQVRKTNFLPPFSRFISLTFYGRNEKALILESTQYAEKIRASVKGNVLGPAPAPIAFIKGVFRYKMLIITEKNNSIIKNLKNILRFAKCKVKIDNDAVSFY